MEKMKNWQLMQALNIAKEIINTGQTLIPMIIGFTDKGHILFPGFYKSDEEKYRYLGVVSTCFLIYNVDYYISISEGWAGTDPNLRPSQDPNRKDILFAACASRTEKRMLTYEIKETSGKKEFIEYASTANAGGAFMELLPPEGATIPEEERQKLIKKMEELGLMVKPNEDDIDLPPDSTIN